MDSSRRLPTDRCHSDAGVGGGRLRRGLDRSARSEAAPLRSATHRRGQSAPPGSGYDWRHTASARRDGNRWRHFVGLARRWQDAEITRQFLVALENKLGDADATVDERPAAGWVEWARERLAAYDPLAAGAGPILQDIAKVDAWTYRD